MAGCGADTDAKTIYNNLVDGTSFPIPRPNTDGPEFQIPENSGTGVFAPIVRLTNADLTTGTVQGNGTFDALMKGFDAQLKLEYEANRITGSQYAEAYIRLTEAAMGAAVQYLLGRDAAYWNAVQTQIQAQQAQVELVTARVGLVTAKTQLASIQNQALNAQAEYALTKMKLAAESSNYCISQFNLNNILPSQNANLQEQKNLLQAQVKLTTEQFESQRGQSLDTRSDGSTVAGILGVSKRLQEQQIESYKRASENNAAKIFSDAWITMKTIDEGLNPPNGFSNANLDVILTSLKNKNGL